MMRIRAVLSEAGRNLLTGTTRATTLALTLAAIGTAVGVAEAAAIRDVLQDASAFRSAGASTMVIAAEDGIDGAACERLRGVDGIGAAGAIRSAPERLRLRALPSAPVPLSEVTPGFTRVLGIPDGTERAGLFLSEQLAGLVGRGTGERLWTAHGTVEIAGVFRYPADGRSPELEYAAVSPVPATGWFDQCWAEVWPTSTRTTQLLRLSLSASLPPGAEVTISQHNSTLGADFDGPGRFHDRVTSYAAVVGLLAGFALGYLAIRLRRLELASALHAGVPRGAQLLQVCLETGTWAVIAVLIGAPAVWYMALTVDDGAHAAVVWLQARCLLGTAAGAVLGAVLATLLTRERHLFRYFKER
jgi:hypothetical protein